MSLLKIAVEMLPSPQRSRLEMATLAKIEVGNGQISKLDLCEGGSISTAIFNSDIQISV